MAKTFTQGYQQDQAQGTPIGDNLTGEEICGFDPSVGSVSYGFKLNQLKTWLTGFFTDKSYEARVAANETNIAANTSSIATNTSGLAAKMDKIAVPTEDNAILQDANGNAKDAGVPLTIIRMSNEVEVLNWYNNQDGGRAHGIGAKPDMIHLELVFLADVAGYLTGETLEYGFGFVGSDTVNSTLAVQADTSNFTIKHSSGVDTTPVAKCLSVPHKNPAMAPVLLEESEVKFSLTFMKVG